MIDPKAIIRVFFSVGEPPDTHVAHLACTYGALRDDPTVLQQVLAHLERETEEPA